MGTPSSLPPPGRPSLGGGGVSGVMAAKCPEMSKTVREIRVIQDQLMSTVRPACEYLLSLFSFIPHIFRNLTEFYSLNIRSVPV